MFLHITVLSVEKSGYCDGNMAKELLLDCSFQSPQRLDGSIKGELRKQALDHFNAEGSEVW